MKASTRKTQLQTRFVVGIDLGTTNICAAYVDLEHEAVPKLFEIPQVIDVGEVAERRLLPAFCYFPAPRELPEGALQLPWSARAEHAVGEFARTHGAAVPGRLVASAKSWLAHAGVDRTRGILPWGGDLGDEAVSPVRVARLYLEHLRAAWDRRFGTEIDADGTPCRLAEQQVVLTVPASFDEAARELTVQAAREAGLEQIVLLEEPLAAFYAWLCRNQERWQHELAEDETVLVIDIGGGTTDFSLIHLEPGMTLRRTAVGKHLLLGGDNMDMALARRVETAWGTQLDAREWSRLCLECRRAKECILNEPTLAEVKVALTGKGTRIVGGTRSHTLSRRDVLETILDGFFPIIDPAAPEPKRRAGIREMGLPYAADPAITKHLLHFLRRVGQPRAAESQAPLVPDRVLFNGGALLPPIVTDRIITALEHWAGGRRVRRIEADDLALAVSHGAAYYGLVRLGRGVRVKGGIARAYYLEVDAGDRQKLVCVMPRDTAEGIVLNLEAPHFRVTANQPVSFPIYCSATRLDDKHGDILADREDISPLPPLQTTLKHGSKGRRCLDVQIATRLNEIGTLDVWCCTLDGEHTYPLRFDLRGRDGAPDAQGATVAAARRQTAVATMAKAFDHVDGLPGVTRKLEDVIGLDRNDWGGPLLRDLADWMIENPDIRTRTAQHEIRWLNLAGFLLRPGFGAPGDEWRLRELWKIWHAGLLAKRHAQVRAEWWICWRRVAGGLRAGQQQQVGNLLLRELLPKNAPGLGPRKRPVQEGTEMWRCLGALERLPAKTKTVILRRLLEQGERLQDVHFWVAARLGARRLFHGPADAVIPAARLETMLPDLFALLRRHRAGRMPQLAVTSLCQRSGIRNLDLAPDTVAAAETILQQAGAPAEWREKLSVLSEASRDYQAELVGDSLPLGLALTPDCEDQHAP